MSDGDELSSVSFDESGDVVQSKLDDQGLLWDGESLLLLSCLDDSLCHCDAACLALCLLLWFHLGEDLEECGGGGLVEGVSELVQCRGHPQAAQQNGLLALQADVQRPADITVHVSVNEKKKRKKEKEIML